MIPLLVGLVLLAAGVGGLWQLHQRERRRRERAPSPPVRLPDALARYLVEGLGWVACLVLACTGAATCIWALAALQGR